MQRDKYLGMNMMRITQSAFACLFLTLGGCSYFHAAPALRPALPTNGCKPTAVVDSNKAGIARYNERRMEAAKEKFLAAVEQGPKCAEAHYNLGLFVNLAADLLFHFSHPRLKHREEIRVVSRKLLHEHFRGRFNAAFLQCDENLLVRDFSAEHLRQLELLSRRAPGHSENLVLEVLEFGFDIHEDPHDPWHQPAFPIHEEIVRQDVHSRLTKWTGR